MIATIAHNDTTRDDRVNLTLRQDDETGRYWWHAQAEGEDEYQTDVFGDTKAEAIEAAQSAWGDPVWDLRIEPTLAEDFLAECAGMDVSEMMDALGTEELEVTQDWNEGTTTWRFADQSAVRISGPEVETLIIED